MQPLGLLQHSPGMDAWVASMGLTVQIARSTSFGEVQEPSLLAPRLTEATAHALSQVLQQPAWLADLFSRLSSSLAELAAGISVRP